ncbi:MAG: hypothetical protein GOMPHAMPRED_003053 [Gomphillus americanus]|uniref:Uncharacterized protein n=1 Tax=Gomphillus americanus TaxID=1940652 RepID=A0A8H3I9C7_9LECA|nr:MAG: hypothetical protein GOMPHAMPRED_003053 [Gomphillus americanus]
MGDRCNRLKKVCQPLVPARRRASRPTKITTSAATKQERLEQKLDSLVSLLEAQGNTTDSASAVAKIVNLQPVNSQSAPPTNQAPPRHLDYETPSAAATSIPTVSTPGTSPYSQHDSTLTTSYGEAQQILDRLRNEGLRFFPFMYFPPHLTVMQLQHDFPTLWLSISALSAKTLTQLSSVSETLQKTIIDKIYVQGERDIDLLLAILFFVGWFRHQRKQAAFFNMWAGLAVSLALELGLNKATLGEGAYFCYLSVWPTHKSAAKRERTMLERRAILATFLMNSWVTTSFRKGDSMKWVPYMDECLRKVESEPEWDGDKMLALQVRCQLIIEQVSDSPWSRDLLDDGTKKGAPDYFIKSLTMQLRDVRAKTNTLTKKQQEVLEFFILNTELTIHEAAQELPLTSNNDNNNNKSIVIPHKKITTFLQALYTIKAWLDNFFNLSESAYPDITFSMFSQFIHCIVSLFRLSTIDDPNWDRDVVKQTVDLVQVIERFAMNVEKVRDTRNLVIDNDEEDMFTKSTALMRRLAAAWSAEIAAVGLKKQQQQQQQQDPAAEKQVVPEIEVPPELMDLDLLDSEWLTEMFLSWDH